MALDQLPIELCHLIFGYLDLAEVSTCRLVSKKFNEIVKAYRVRELSFYEWNYERRTCWFYDAKPIYPSNSLSISKVAVLSSTSIDLQYLKRLLFYTSNGVELQPEVVNRFENLEHLDLYLKNRPLARHQLRVLHFGDRRLRIRLPYGRPEGTSEGEMKQLKLKSLKHVYINFKWPISIEFDTSKLESVALEYEPNEDEESDEPIEEMRFVAASTVKELFTFNLFQDALPKSFGGLERLQCDLLDELDLDKLLQTFPQLSVLDFVQKEGVFDDCDAALARIIRERDRLRPSLKICFESFLLSGRQTIESYAFDKQSELTLLIKHHSSLLGSTNLLELDYAELMSLTKNGYPIGFLESRPFARVHLVSVNGMIDDPDRLLNFLLNCVNLEDLRLNNCSLTQEFFDKLPAFTSLQRLDICAHRDLQLDFSRFLFKITNLVDLNTDQNLTIGLLRELMQKLQFVYSLIFTINGRPFAIFEHLNGEFELEEECLDGNWKSIKKVACKNLIEQLFEKIDEQLIKQLVEQLIERIDEPTSDSPMDL